MFRCGICGEQSKIGEKASMALLAKRWRPADADGRYQGWEIAEETRAHTKCVTLAGEPGWVNEQPVFREETNQRQEPGLA